MSSILGAVKEYLWPSIKQTPENAESFIHVRDEDDAVVVDLCDEQKQKTAKVAQRVLPQSHVSEANQLPKNKKEKPDSTYRKATHSDLFGVGKKTLKKQDKKY